MTRIALVPSAFYPSLGGVEELTRQLAHRLDEPLVVTQRWPRDLPATETIEGLTVRRLPFRAPVGGLKAMATYPVTRPVVRRRLVDLLREAETDVVHVQCVSATALYAAMAADTLGLPLVVSLQGELTMDASQTFQRSAFMRRLLRRVLDQAAAITACSAATLAEAEAFYGQAFCARGSVVHNGVNLADFAHPGVADAPDGPYVLAVGRLVPQKGFDVLLRAWAAAETGDRVLVLAGDGPDRVSLQALAADLGITATVRFYGRAERQAVVGLFQGCEFFVLPSRHEPQGIVTLEAMAAGRAVLATDVGGVSEIVLHGETGLLVPGGSVQALAAGVARLVAMSEERETLGAAGRARAELFDWSQVAERYVEIYARSTARR